MRRHMPASRSALYSFLGLVDAQLPLWGCGGCPTCRGADSAPPASYESARHVAADRLVEIAKQRAQDYEDARKRLSGRVELTVEAHVLQFSPHRDRYTKEA